MDWFETLFGFAETDAASVTDQLEVDGCELRSRVNGASYQVGRLETPTLGDLRQRFASSDAPPRSTQVRNIVGDAGALHADAANAGALFQVASQFNLLEMVSPDVTPERGVTRYAGDRTQGPACAIAAGPATVYRNYFTPVGDQIGQTAEQQIDCLRDVHQALSPGGAALWEMRNGYALCSEQGITQINEHLSTLDESGLDAIRSKLRIGLHWDVQVTQPQPAHCVSQAYCSALPVAYSSVSSSKWQAFARLVLEASYEACLLAGLENAQRVGNALVFLTKLGGGVFGNDTAWIRDAMARAFSLAEDWGLDVRVVHFGAVDREFLGLEGD
jgi:hypothetical protein